MKKIISVLLSVLMAVSVFGFSVNAFAEQTEIYTDSDLTVGDTVDIPVYIKNGAEVLGFGFEVSYNSEVLVPVSVTKSELLNDGSFNDSIGTEKYSNPFRVVWAGSSELNTDGLLFTIRFSVVGDSKTNVTVSSMPLDTFYKDYSKADVNSIKIEIAKKCNHIFDNGVVTKKATPTAKGVKTYTCTLCGETKTETIPKCDKYANPIKASGKMATVKYSSLKKKNQTVAQKNAFSVTKAQGKVTYSKSSGNSKITVSSAGKITVKKGLKKGTYKIKVKVKAAGNSTYKSASKTVTVTIKVK